MYVDFAGGGMLNLLFLILIFVVIAYIVIWLLRKLP